MDKRALPLKLGPLMNVCCKVITNFPAQVQVCSACQVDHIGNGRAIPLQVWSGPEGSRKLRFPDFMTMAQDSGKVVSLTHRPPLPPGNTPGTHFC